jgi:DNA-binding GntR family transcriptional regulator
MEIGILRTIDTVKPAVITTLRDHIRQEREAIASDDVGARHSLLGDVHVCMVEAFGNRILTGNLLGRRQALQIASESITPKNAGPNPLG